MAEISDLFDKNEVQDFKSLFRVVIQDLWDDGCIGKEIPESLARLQKSLEYNVPYHIECRGFLIPFAYKSAVKTTPSESEYNLAKRIGWVVQIYTTLLALTDDMYDDTESRFGKASWWYLNKKSVICINDTLLLEQLAFRLLEKYLGDQPSLYAKICSCLNNMMYQYYLGESLEMVLLNNLEHFSMDRYMAFQKYTVLNGPYFSLHFEIAFWLADNQDKDLMKEIKEICNELGYLWTVTDDLTDSYGDRKQHNGVHDSDIRRGSINWLIVTAKEMCNSQQWATLQKNYGKPDDACVEKVKNVYQELGIPELCKSHIKKNYDELLRKIQKIEERGEAIAKPLLAMVISYANLNE